jgi:hypothetical protein
MAPHHQLSPSPSNTLSWTTKKPRPPGPQMTTSTMIRWSSLEQDSSQSELTPLSWTSTPSVSTLPYAMPGLSQRPFTVTIPGGRHSRTTEARRVNQEAWMCQADPTHPLLWFYSLALNAPGGPPGPSAPAAEAAAAATVTPAVAALVRAHFRQSHQIHRTGGLHGY